MWKYLLVIFITIQSSSWSSAQIKPEVKQYMDSLPAKLPSIGNLAVHIQQRFVDEEDIAAAAYYWIAKNIVFDAKEHFAKKKKFTYNFRYKNQDEKKQKIQKVNIGLAEEAFKRKKAVAKGYALLFKKLCNNAGLECEVVEGSSKQTFKHIGRKPGRSNHNWNVVNIHKEWYLVDVTWGAGILNEKNRSFIPRYNETFFMTKPSSFFLNHYPKNKKWLLCNRDEEEFTFLPLFHPSYLRTGILLESPSLGLITPMEGDTIQISFKRQYPTDSHEPAFSYAYEEDRKPRFLDIHTNNDTIKLFIPTKKKRYDYLTIYDDDHPLVSFKVKQTRMIH